MTMQMSKRRRSHGGFPSLASRRPGTRQNRVPGARLGPERSKQLAAIVTPSTTLVMQRSKAAQSHLYASLWVSNLRLAAQNVVARERESFLHDTCREAGG
jgi:hypothetical protein